MSLGSYTPKSYMYYTTLPNHSRSQARLGKHKIEIGTAILFNSKQLEAQIARTRDTKLCKWQQKLCPDSSYEAELEEGPRRRG